MKNLLVLLVAYLSMIGIANAQVTSASGLVVDDSNEPVVGATVLVKGTMVGVVTDFDGKFQITNLPEDAKTLVISYIGMDKQEVAISSSPVTVVLQSDSELLEDVIVSGYTTSKKAAYTGAAQVVTNEKIATKSDANFLKSLEGSVAGFQMNNGSGQPGAYSTTTIRGTSSLNSGTEPLYVIDGVPMFTGNLSSNTSMGVSPLTNLNANDIESITVLKDATASSIYGARAANGVIVITTKRGKSGEAKVDFTMQYGSTFLGQMDHDYKMVGLDRFKEVWTEGVQNGYAAGNIISDEDLSIASNAAEYARQRGIAYYNSDWNTAPDTDWLDEALKTSDVQKYGVSIQGGKEDLNYFASLEYYSNGGIVIGSGMDRYSARLNLDGTKGILSYGMSTNYSVSDVDEIPRNSAYTNPIVLAYDTRPFQRIYDENGGYANINHDYNLVALFDKEDGDVYKQKTSVTIWNPYFSLDLMDGLKWKTSAGLTVTEADQTSFRGRNNPRSYSGGAYSTMRGSESIHTATTYSLTNTINYQHTFNKIHDLNVLLGQESQKQEYEGLTATAEGYPLADVQEMVNASTPTAASSTLEASSLVSFFSNFEYGYNEKYYLSASLRYDGSSRFGKNNRWAPFWSVGGKYRLTQEDFMEPYKDWLYNFMIHASYGSVGNQDIGYYAAQGLYSYGDSYNSGPGATPSQIENPDLKWETVYKADLGFNINLWGNLDLDIDLYDERTKDMIFDVPLTMTSGFNSLTQNVGEMSNKGIELMLNWGIVNTKDFTWNTTLTYTYNKNEIVALATDDPITSNWNIQQAGSPINTFFLKEWAGVDPQTGEGLWYVNGKGSETTTDVNSANQVTLGQASPKYFGALGMNFKYKDFDFSFDVSYSGGNKVFNRGFQYDMHVGSYSLGPVSNYVFENRWQEPGDITDVPKFTWGGNRGAAQLTSRFLMDGSYARVKNVTIGYNLPDDICSKLSINNLRVYASADNLYTFTAKNFMGFDPQARADGYVQWAYPVATTVMFGVNLGL